MEPTYDFLLSSTSDYLLQLDTSETMPLVILRRLLPWRCVVEGRHFAVVENVANDQFFIAICGGDGLVVQVTWQRLIFLLRRLDAYRVARGEQKLHIERLLEMTVVRLLAWSSLVTQDYWITPYPKQDALRHCFSLSEELFASPLDVNLQSSVFCTPYEGDTIFGAVDNSYRIWWHFCALGNPIYTVAHIRKCISHALFSARSTRKPVRIVLIVPYWQSWDETEGVELVCLLKKKKFAFLAPQSALGFQDRSTGARFDVSVLLIQNKAAAKLRPVTQRGLMGVEKAFGAAVDDRGVRYLASWGVGFCWRAAAAARPLSRLRRKEEFELMRFRNLTRGSVTAGVFLQNLGSELTGEIQRAAERQENTASETALIPTVGEFRTLMTKLNGLARGTLDRNVTVGFAVCGQVYQRWLQEERDGGNYEVIDVGSAEVVRMMAQKFKAAGLNQVATFDLKGSFGVLYLMVKHKDASLCLKRRPVVPCFNAPDRMLQNRVGRSLCFLIEQLEGHFNVAATQEITGRLLDFNAAVGRGDLIMAAGFDVKEMYVRLKPAVVLKAAEYVVAHAMGGGRGVLVRTRGRKGVQWFEAGCPRKVAVLMTTERILAGVRFILDHGFLFVAGSLVRQISGIGIGGGASPGLAQCVCVFGEREWTEALGCDRRLMGIRAAGIRLMDDCTLLAAVDKRARGGRRLLKEIFTQYLSSCYPEGVSVEQTSETLVWTFCGMTLSIDGGGVAAKLFTKNVQAGVVSGDQLIFFPFVSYSSDCGRVQKMASTLNALYRVERHCTNDVLKAAAVIDVLRELRWQGYPRGWLFEGLERMAARTPPGFWHKLLRGLERAGLRL